MNEIKKRDLGDYGQGRKDVWEQSKYINQADYNHLLKTYTSEKCNKRLRKLVQKVDIMQFAYVCVHAFGVLTFLKRLNVPTDFSDEFK